MPKLTATPPRKLRAFFRSYPWLWGVTKLWYVGQDVVRVKALTAAALRPLIYTILLHGDSDYFIYRCLKPGVYEVDWVGRHDWKEGVSLASVIRHERGVHFLVHLRMSGDNDYQRYFTIYKVPHRRLRSICDRAMVKDKKKTKSKNKTKARR